MTDDSDPSSSNITHQTGGADLSAGHDLTIGSDVVGRDKIEQHDSHAVFDQREQHVDQQVNVAGNYYAGDQQYDVHSLANPYLGLQSFTYADHAKYAGREKLIAETVARLTAPDDPLALLFVTGASGSGKSSFVQAGATCAGKALRRAECEVGCLPREHDRSFQ